MATLGIGMLWFDNDKTTNIAYKIGQAASYYHKKYHYAPAHCAINPKDADADISSVGGVLVHICSSVLPSHIWIGDNYETQ